jgi:hypothetical protein
VENRVMKSIQVSSVVSRTELPSYLKKYAEDNEYPVGRVRWSENQDRFFGYGQGYVVAGKQLPPIPGGWELTIEKTEIEKRKIWVPDTMLRAVQTKTGLPRLLDSYVQEGLLFTKTEEVEAFHEAAGEVYIASGHPRLLDTFEQVLDGF